MKFLKWMGIVCGCLVLLIVIAGVYSQVASQRKLSARYPIPAGAPLALPTDSAAIAEGERLGHLAGCQHCHGDGLTGIFIVEIPNIARFVSPNVSQLLGKYSDAQLEAAIRDGVRLDGTSNWFMPTPMLHHLRDADVAKIMAWVRTLPPREGTHEATEFRALGRALIAAGKFTPGAEAAAHAPPEPEVNDADPVSHGRYLVMSFCSECHGQNLEGNELAQAPPLAVAKAYALEDFSRLMHEGQAVGGRALGLMRETAVARFSHFTPEEVHDMHTFLKSRTDAD